ncbi:phospholipid-transporting ATPase IF-like isoform X2 [Lineus longissimus]|uniref:phospholipid-transporting ATPase IF-like isoform X2 n=1 Tax=Lineus longissimus TaxID=88925 RepID=UPI00315D40B2
MGSFIFRALEKCFKSMPCCRKPPRPENRTIFVGNQAPLDEEVLIPETFVPNHIITSKYTAWNFLPKNLFEQLQRIANFYFCCMGIIMFLIDSPVSPATSILPLVFVLSVTAIKQGYEDWLRHTADKEVNNRQAYVVRNGELMAVKSMEIKVGDIVRVQMNQGFPCDLVLLSSHDNEGDCSITTANLDGETNLKTFNCIPETRQYQNVEALTDLRAKIECQQPITDLYKFIGRITLYDTTSGGAPIVRPLGPENVLLRGAMLKNTPFIFGSAIYTGQETKMALNSKFKRSKFSRVERRLNQFLIAFLILLAIEVAVCTGLQYYYIQQPRPWYQPPHKDINVHTVIGDIFAFLTLFNYIIPISLYVSIELQKFFGSMFFGWDIEMYDAQINQPAKANTSDLNEELGQVEYLFTDKTGTLTENDMQFRQCSINGVRYIEHGGMLCERPDIPGVQPQPVHKFSDEIMEFLEVLVLCHTVRVDRQEVVQNGTSYGQNPAGQGMEYEYQASSPDEKAFVEACRRYGIVFHGTKDTEHVVSFKEDTRRYKVLYVLDFDANRKCMSVIIQNPDGEIILLCKGAESSLLQRCTSGTKEATLHHVNEYAMVGLRTLVIAHRRLSPDEFEHFNEKLTEAKKTLENREKKLSEIYDEVEQNLHLLGATAVEDRLQDGVPMTIQALRRAGIKVWVLTGDKEETAVNISYSAGHFKQGMVELRLTKQENALECEQLLKQFQMKMSDAGGIVEHVLVIDGISLAHVLHDYGDLFLTVCQKCMAVLCCRMTPLQKAEVVRLVKHSKAQPVTAAIGDGANDVSMIQEADVGLGIMGKEGRQAVRCSDYAFGRFRFLMRAFLVHGHWYYVRLATLVQYFFYKNIAFITAEVYYACFSSFSQQSVYESIYLMFYNTTFTALPILVFGLFEQHISQEALLRKPELYKEIRGNSRLSPMQFLKWNLNGLWHSLVCFFGVYLLFGDEVSISPDGKMYGVWSFGTIVVHAVVFTVNIKLGIEAYFWNPALPIAYFVTCIGFFPLILVYNIVIWPSWLSESLLLRVVDTVLASGIVWLGILLLVVLSLLPDLIMKAVKDTFYTRKIDPRKKHSINKTECSTVALLWFELTCNVRKDYSHNRDLTADEDVPEGSGTI